MRRNMFIESEIYIADGDLNQIDSEIPLSLLVLPAVPIRDH